jgi:hypothetical protein
MRQIVSLSFALVGLITVSTALAAQSGIVQPGTVVRIAQTGASDALVGTLVSRTRDSLMVVVRGNDAMVRLPAASVQSIDIMNGKRRVEPALKWGLIGGGIWGLVAAAVPFDKCSENMVPGCADSRGQFMAIQATGMAIVVGSIIAFRGEDRWVRVEGSAAPASVVVAPSPGGVSVGLRFVR